MPDYDKDLVEIILSIVKRLGSRVSGRLVRFTHACALKMYRIALRCLELEEHLASSRKVNRPPAAEPATGGSTLFSHARGQRDSQTDLRPIVFIHSTDSIYLKYALAQAARAIPRR